MILTHRFPLDEFPELYAAFDKKEHGIMKTFVQTRFSNPLHLERLFLVASRRGISSHLLS